MSCERLDYQEDIRGPAMIDEPDHRDGDDGDAPLTIHQIANVISLSLHAIAKVYPKERPHFEEVLDGWPAFLRGERLHVSGSTAWWVSIFAGILGSLEGWCGKDALIAAVEIARNDLSRPEAQA